MTRKHREFDVQSFLASFGFATKTKDYRKNDVLFSEGDPARDILFILEGSVKRTVVSVSGKEAVVGILGRGDFLGTWCLTGHRTRIATATALLPTRILAIGKGDMVRALHAGHALSDHFIAYLIARTVSSQEYLVDQLFDTTEKRLARMLLRLTRYGEQRKNETVMPTFSQELLAEMIGTTRQQVSTLMNKFRRRGLIDYNGKLKVHRSLLAGAIRDKSFHEKAG